jgi:membrane-bound ClpP family serine protease
MDYGPTIAAAFASPNEREVFNLRTILVETMKRSQPASIRESRNPAATHYAAYNSRPATAGTGYMNAPDPVNMANGGMYGQSSPRHFSSSASTGRLEYGRTSGGESVYSQNSHKSYGVMSAGPVERSRDPVSNYVSGYNAQTYVGRNGRY